MNEIKKLNQKMKEVLESQKEINLVSNTLTPLEMGFEKIIKDLSHSMEHGENDSRAYYDLLDSIRSQYVNILGEVIGYRDE